MAHVFGGRILHHDGGPPKQGAASPSMAAPYATTDTRRLAWTFVSSSLERRRDVFGRLCACDIPKIDVSYFDEL
jgi:hypothetical protein